MDAEVQIEPLKRGERDDLSSKGRNPNSKAGSQGDPACFHCGTPCSATAFAIDQKCFCCVGCKTVFEILSENGLSDFYQLDPGAGVRINAGAAENQFAYLDQPEVRSKIVQFADARITRVTFECPAIHCIACVWLLERLFRLKEGIGESRVNFPRKEVVITFETARVKLSDVVRLLASLGYTPELKFSDLQGRQQPISRRLWF